MDFAPKLFQIFINMKYYGNIRFVDMDIINIIQFYLPTSVRRNIRSNIYKLPHAVITSHAHARTYLQRDITAAVANNIPAIFYIGI